MALIDSLWVSTLSNYCTFFWEIVGVPWRLCSLRKEEIIISFASWSLYHEDNNFFSFLSGQRLISRYKYFWKGKKPRNLTACSNGVSVLYSVKARSCLLLWSYAPEATFRYLSLHCRLNIRLQTKTTISVSYIWVTNKFLFTWWQSCFLLLFLFIKLSSMWGNYNRFYIRKTVL